MREFDEVDELKKRAALRWLAAVWGFSMAYFLLAQKVDPYELKLWILGATSLCVVAALLAAFFWRLARWILLVASAIACGLLIPVCFLMTVYGGWNDNLWQYVVLIAGTFAMYCLARTCGR